MAAARRRPRRTAASRPRPPRAQPAAPRDALEDTSVKPEIPKPSGSPPRKLEKEDIVKGKGPAAKAGDTVVVHYAGVSFSTGEEFDASWNAGQPFSFPLGGGAVIPGWDEGVAGMRKGGRRQLTIPPELAYGAAGLAARDRPERDARVRDRPARNPVAQPAKLSA